MMKLRTKLILFNLLSKLAFAVVFIAAMPYMIEKINITQTDRELTRKREQVIALINNYGIETYIEYPSENTFGNYTILKDEFISLERTDPGKDIDSIAVTERNIENETISFRVLSYSFMDDGQAYLLEIGKSLEDITHARKNIVRLTWGLLAFIILITFLADLYYSYRILRPLDLVINKLKGTSAPDLFDKVAINTSTYDLHQLDQTLIELMNRIDELFRKEKNITVNVSHDLLTPISVLRSKLENILLQENLDNETSSRIEESLRTLHRLKTLVNSHLFIARIENRLYLKNETFSINGIIEEIMNELSPITADAGISMIQQTSVDMQIAKANRSLIFSMFYNVINNAVRNTLAGGKVTLISSYDRKKFTMTVSDTGTGIGEEQLKTLFSRFNTRSNVDEDHVGIGLAITKTIADFHNIIISVDSKINTGTNFSFIFPENS
ncbi:MAG: HAMP domain-containing sensor histidine kinase [Bacteroidales bacterium]|jgi:signal transduction histidine kinase